MITKTVRYAKVKTKSTISERERKEGVGHLLCLCFTFALILLLDFGRPGRASSSQPSLRCAPFSHLSIINSAHARLRVPLPLCPICLSQIFRLSIPRSIFSPIHTRHVAHVSSSSSSSSLAHGPCNRNHFTRTSTHKYTHPVNMSVGPPTH